MVSIMAPTITNSASPIASGASVLPPNVQAITSANTTKIGGYKIGNTLPFFQLYPNHHPDVHEVLFLPSNPNVMISGSDGGIHRTENCLAPFVEWSYLNNSYVTSQFYSAVIDKNAPGDNTLLGGLQDNGNFFVNSADPQAPWKQTVNGDGSYGAIAPGNLRETIRATGVNQNGELVLSFFSTSFVERRPQTA